MAIPVLSIKDTPVALEAELKCPDPRSAANKRIVLRRCNETYYQPVPPHPARYGAEGEVCSADDLIGLFNWTSVALSTQICAPPWLTLHTSLPGMPAGAFRPRELPTAEHLALEPGILEWQSDNMELAMAAAVRAMLQSISVDGMLLMQTAAPQWCLQSTQPMRLDAREAARLRKSWPAAIWMPVVAGDEFAAAVRAQTVLVLEAVPAAELDARVEELATRRLRCP